MVNKSVLLAVLALALPMAAFANSSVDITNLGGSLSTNAGGGLTLSNSTMIEFGGIVGTNLGTVSFSTGSLQAGGSLSSGGTFNSGGSFVITGNGSMPGVPNGVIFSGSFSGPVTWSMITLADGSHNYNLTGAVSGTWFTGATVVGATTQLTVNTSTGFFNGLGLASGNTNITVVPEPGTLTLFGTGLIGLAGVIRRKLNAG